MSKELWESISPVPSAVKYAYIKNMCAVNNNIEAID